MEILTIFSYLAVAAIIVFAAYVITTPVKKKK